MGIIIDVIIIDVILLTGAKLTLFGSSCNGFGFGHSDLDICMTLEQETAEVRYPNVCSLLVLFVLFV